MKKLIILLLILLCSCTSQKSYFSLADEGNIANVKSQYSGTCWVTAASTSIESSYKMKYNQDIEIDPSKIADDIYDDNKEEGYFLKKGTDKYDFGGWSWMIIEAAANGIEDYILTEGYGIKEFSRDEIKDVIENFGAVTIDINDYSYRFGTFDGKKTLNALENDFIDHAVVLIGWDDNFPKENFKKPASQNGAWLAQNSKGPSWGNDGRYWISYDTPLESPTIFSVSKDYEHVEYYDGAKFSSIQTGDKTTVYNKFHYEGLLKAVGTYTTKPNQKLDISIYDDNDNLLTNLSTTEKLEGYHLIQLKEPINVKDYRIQITYDGQAPVEGESWQDGVLSFVASIDKDVSYVKIDDKWYDLSSPNTIAKLHIDFMPNNCSIKAIY